MTNCVNFCLSCRARNELHLVERLIEVPQDVLDILQPDAKADEIRRNARRLLLLLIELAVGGGSGVDGQALGVADISQVAEQSQVVDELGSGFPPAVYAEPQDAPASAGQIFLRQGVVGESFKPGISHPGHLRMVVQEFRNFFGVLHSGAACAG